MNDSKHMGRATHRAVTQPHLPPKVVPASGRSKRGCAAHETSTSACAHRPPRSSTLGAARTCVERSQAHLRGNVGMPGTSLRPSQHSTQNVWVGACRSTRPLRPVGAWKRSMIATWCVGGVCVGGGGGGHTGCSKKHRPHTCSLALPTCSGTAILRPQHSTTILKVCTGGGEHIGGNQARNARAWLLAAASPLMARPRGPFPPLSPRSCVVPPPLLLLACPGAA